jgi:hypothetical protein
MDFDIAQIDELLATTRAVRRRLDFSRPVDNQLLLDRIDLAEQAPTGGTSAAAAISSSAINVSRHNWASCTATRRCRS